MKITWLGHSCFKIGSQGYEIILDPYEDRSVPGLRPVREQADQVLCSHGHGDHCGTEGVALRQGAAARISVEAISTWHDDRQGALRGPNTIHILDDGQCRVAHLGDLGCELTPKQKEKLRGLTALLIPVGGPAVCSLFSSALCVASHPILGTACFFRLLDRIRGSLVRFHSQHMGFAGFRVC